MEAETLPSLTSLLQGVDQWREVLVVLPLLVVLEVVLSADNAIALAAISRRLHDPQKQRQALNLGLLLALGFRILLIIAARWVLRFWPLQLLAAAYLLWLSCSHLLGGDAAPGPEPATGDSPSVAAADGQASLFPPLPDASVQVRRLAGVVVTLGLTDLAFSLDSVAAAVAVTDRLALVMAGGVIGVVALRLTAELFIRWLEEFRHLETSGYLAVGLVGIRLLVRLINPDLVLPEWAVLLSVALLFAWGFSSRQEPVPMAARSDAIPSDAAPSDPLPLDAAAAASVAGESAHPPAPATIAEASQAD
jgi:YkoY family integral membrane protein